MGKDGILPKFRKATIEWMKRDSWYTTDQVYTFLKGAFRRGPSKPAMCRMLSMSPEFGKRGSKSNQEWCLK